MFSSIWYLNLKKPFLSPPDWVFAPVWTVLYILIFSSLFLYVISKGQNKLSGYIFFALQLFLNVSWTWAFFGLKNILFGLIITILLDIIVFLMIYKFFKISKIAGIILVPYFVWILFATYLNASYLVLNK